MATDHVVTSGKWVTVRCC